MIEANLCILFFIFRLQKSLKYMLTFLINWFSLHVFILLVTHHLLCVNVVQHIWSNHWSFCKQEQQWYVATILLFYDDSALDIEMPDGFSYSHKRFIQFSGRTRNTNIYFLNFHLPILFLLNLAVKIPWNPHQDVVRVDFSSQPSSHSSHKE